MASSRRVCLYVEANDSVRQGRSSRLHSSQQQCTTANCTSPPTTKPNVVTATIDDLHDTERKVSTYSDR